MSAVEKSPSALQRLPLLLVVLALPAAVAGQNIMAGVAGAGLLAQLALNWPQCRARLPELRRYPVPLATGAALVLSLILATALNPANVARGSIASLNGHLIWLLLPPVALVTQSPLTAADWRRLYRACALVCAVLGVVALSQLVVGWRVVGSSFVTAPLRARGFYSHPLTFAYVGLLLFPLGAAVVVRRPREAAPWAAFLGATAVVAASQSRTVQAVCAAVLGLNVWWAAPRRARPWLLAGVAVVVALVVATDNPVGTKFRETFSGGHDVRSGYADDRLAFWHAHANMFLERPVLGHGDHLNSAYRARYYDELGLGGFERQYEAHNMYLQLAVNGGLVGLGLFGVWYGWCVRRARRLARTDLGGTVALQALSALAVAAITQNAFQDAEVRYALTLLVTALWLAPAADATPPLSVSSPALARPT